MTKRQKMLLDAIIREFMESAQAVGSINLSDKHDLGVSPATIRNEMARLCDLGYLRKAHASSGRIPTTLGWRYFLQELMEEEDIEPLEEVKLRENIFRERFAKDRLLKQAVDALAAISKNAAVVAVDDSIFYSGITELLDYSEFQEIEALQNIFSVLEDYQMLNSLFQQSRGEDDVRILIGDEIGIESLGDCSIVFTEFPMYRGKQGIIAVLGPNRLRYERVIPAVRSIARTLEEAVAGW